MKMLMGGRRGILFLVVCIILIGGCTQFKQSRFAEHGINPIMNSDDVDKNTKTLEAVMNSFKVRAGYSSGTIIDSTNGYEIYLAGANYIGTQCDSYLEALQRYNKYLSRAKGYTTSSGTLTQVVLAAANASTLAIGVTAASFGFINEILDITANTVLFELEPSGVRQIVEKQMQQYAENQENLPSSDFDTEPKVAEALRIYLRFCLPSSIEGAVNLAVKAADPQVGDKGETVF